MTDPHREPETSDGFRPKGLAIIKVLLSDLRCVGVVCESLELAVLFPDQCEGQLLTASEARGLGYGGIRAVTWAAGEETAVGKGCLT